MKRITAHKPVYNKILVFLMSVYLFILLNQVVLHMIVT